MSLKALEARPELYSQWRPSQSLSGVLHMGGSAIAAPSQIKINTELIFRTSLYIAIIFIETIIINLLCLKMNKVKYVLKSRTV